MNCLYLLEINPLSVVSYAIDFFSHYEHCLFTLFIVSFAVEKPLSLIMSHLIICFFLYCRRWVIEELAVIYDIECSACVFHPF